MKNGRNVLLLICALFLALLLGVFIGRNTTADVVMLKEKDPPASISKQEETSDYQLDINTATKAQLMELPGIGEVIAERIIAYRTNIGNFESVDDLMNVEGIGETKLQKINRFIRIGG